MASGRHPSSVFLIVLLALALSAVLSATSCAVTSEQEAANNRMERPEYGANWAGGSRRESIVCRQGVILAGYDD